MSEHTILAALTIEANNRQEAHAIAHRHLGPTTDVVTSWWIAEDDRTDGSDTDSAVFVHKGAQHAAHDMLVTGRMTEKHNKPEGHSSPLQAIIVDMIAEDDRNTDVVGDTEGLAYYEGRIDALHEILLALKEGS